MRCVAVLTDPDGALVAWDRIWSVARARERAARSNVAGATLTLWRDIWTDGSLDWPTFVVLREGRSPILTESVR